METSTEEVFNPRDIHMRHTGTDGKPYVRRHRVWDSERFIKSQMSAAADSNGAALKEGKTANAKAEQITEDQFFAEGGGR